VRIGSRVAHQADGVVAVEVHPVQRHEGEKVTDVQGGRCWIDADVCADALFREEPVERLAAAVDVQYRCSELTRAMLTQRHPSRIPAPQAHSTCSAASPTAPCPHALPIAYLARLDPLLRPPISLSVAHRELECVVGVYMTDIPIAVVETDVSRLTWLSIARHRDLGACQNVRSAKTG
jgi:hypothetical protein